MERTMTHEQLFELLQATTISSTGLSITIECSDHDTKDAVLAFLAGEAPAPSTLAAASGI
jgi:hypothetical protein